MELHEILNKLSRKKKVQLCNGRDFWHTVDLSKYGLRSIMMCDGPHGLRCQKEGADHLGLNNSMPATCFPTASLTACSWDTELMYKIGKAIAEEAKSLGVALILGPGVNIKRDPLCGRNFEYFSEDPYIAGKMGAAFIRGAEETGVGSCVKHFALNNQEYKRFNGNSQADERTMREIYLAPFETAIREGMPASVMCAYNKINGVHCSDSHQLLTDILRTQWGFDGLVITDWGAMNDRVAAVKAGCDLNMPGGSDYMQHDVLQALKDGRITDEELDRCALRVLRLMERGNLIHKMPCDLDAHHTLAREAAEESAVLLKNADGILPLKPAQRIALIGAMADKPRYQGAGSSHINPARLVSAREAMPSASFAPGCNTDGSTSDSLLAEAAELAANADIAIVFAGLTDSYESEGFDREDLQMPDGHLKMIDAVCEANENTVVVLCCGGVVACPWADRVKGILYMGLGGQASGEAVWDLLTGKRNPSGKLAETWVNSYEDCPTSVYYRGEKDPQYRECIYVGYRYYDKANVSVRWPFGYGLSYTRFQYSDLKIEGMTVTCTVRNIGECAGKEVVQLYVSAPQQGLHRPVRELKRFAKILLQPGEAREISFQLDDRAFSLWNDGWKIPAGEYTVNICSDSRTVELQQSIWVNGEEIPAPNWQENSWYQHLIGSPDEHSWRSVYGTKTQPLNRTKGQFTMDDTVLELKDHALVMKFLYKCVELVISRPFGYKKDYSNPEFRMLMASSTDSPLSNIQICGGIRGGLMKGLLHIANGHSFRGLLTILGIKK